MPAPRVPALPAVDPSAADPSTARPSGTDPSEPEPPAPGAPLWRRLVAEFTGTALLLTAVVGSGITAARLSPDDVGLELLEHVLAVVGALGALIVLFGPVSGAHFNPLVSVADWYLGRRARTGLTPGDLGGYVLAQTVGAVAGTVLANVMFAVPAVAWSHHTRTGWNVWLGEVVGTAGLILLVFGLARGDRASAAPVAVPAYIGAAVWCTSSYCFVNPAITLARAFSDTFTGISPASVPAFVVAQCVGLLVGLVLLRVLYPDEGGQPAR